MASWKNVSAGQGRGVIQQGEQGLLTRHGGSRVVQGRLDARRRSDNNGSDAAKDELVRSDGGFNGGA